MLLVTRIERVSVLFSEPKIPQFERGAYGQAQRFGFSALQRAENSSMRSLARSRYASGGFSALQRAENSSIELAVWEDAGYDSVSVLFSEPKIPQFEDAADQELLRLRNVSVLFSEPKIPQFVKRALYRKLGRAFQCSSASRKFLNWAPRVDQCDAGNVSVLFSEPKIPQFIGVDWGRYEDASFSALQRAENSSMLMWISQRSAARVSVLFSEPKIPQWLGCVYTTKQQRGFSALQRAENSSIIKSASSTVIVTCVSVLFSEPKIPQCGEMALVPDPVYSFSALQRAENSSIFKPSRATR